VFPRNTGAPCYSGLTPPFLFLTGGQARGCKFLDRFAELLFLIIQDGGSTQSNLCCYNHSSQARLH
jgi:hypothetical protein